MSNTPLPVTSPKLTPELIEREEYEAQLYGFTVREWSDENFSFVNGCITKETKKLTKKLADLIPNPSPKLKEKFSNISIKICEEIFNSCKLEIEEINSYVEKEFSIPDNVILIEDKTQMTSPTAEDEKSLAEECERLEKTVKENAFFIHALGAELDSYEQLNEVFQQRHCIARKAEQLLNKKVDVNVLENAVKKINNLK